MIKSIQNKKKFTNSNPRSKSNYIYYSKQPTAKVNNQRRSYQPPSIRFSGRRRLRFEPFKSFLVSPCLNPQIIGLGSEAHSENNNSEGVGNIARELPVFPLSRLTRGRRGAAEGEAFWAILVPWGCPSAGTLSAATGPERWGQSGPESVRCGCERFIGRHFDWNLRRQWSDRNSEGGLQLGIGIVSLDFGYLLERPVRRRCQNMLLFTICPCKLPELH